MAEPASRRTTTSASLLFHRAEPRSKLNPPQLRCTSLVYTLMASPGIKLYSGKVNVWLLSFLSLSTQPRSCWAPSPRLVIWTYSSDSEVLYSSRTTAPSKRTQSI